MMQYNGFWISGSTMPGSTIHGLLDTWRRCTVPTFRPFGSRAGAVESFELEDQGVAALFGLELARLVVDTGCPELMEMRRNVERPANKTQHRR